ncbi:hypothetical protein AB833_15395 [Chromatiales bacterium (ex Bugula neritina AB1)]|nr:hypothetical protein AB833_15395 [Chromatiales bacterium (ex Bugula neritina AB1)]
MENKKPDAFIMNKLSVVAVLGAICCMPLKVMADQCGWPQQDALASVVRVTSDDGSHASGVVIGINRVLTAAHAIDEHYRSYVLIDDRRALATLTLIDRSRDLAILQVETGKIEPIALGATDLNSSAKVWAVGFPRAESKTTSSGSFKVRAAVDGALHTTAPIDSGQSGGGLISCEQGKHVLAGMLRGFAAYVNGDSYVKIKNHSVSVATADIRSFITEVNSLQN